MTQQEIAIAQAMTMAQTKYALLLGLKRDAESGVVAARQVMADAQETFVASERRADVARRKAEDTARAKQGQTNDEENQKIADWDIKVVDVEADLNQFLVEMKDSLGVDLNFLVREPARSGGSTRL